MALRRVALPADVPGSLWLGSMPGRFETWEQFQADAAQAGITRVVCLTPRHELRSMSPAYHAAVDAGTLPYAWSQVPMRDFGLADIEPMFAAAVANATAALRRGEAVMLHCAAGIGRTGTMAACVLKHLGLNTELALQRVREAGSNPQSALQSGLIERF